MRVEIWLDFNQETKDTIQSFLQALETFTYKDKVLLSYRSKPDNDKNYLYHELMQYGRKKSVTTPLVLALLDLKLKQSSQQDILENLNSKFGFDITDMQEALANKSYHNIVLNHLEHANLKRITQTPCIQMMHGITLSGKSTQDDIKQGLIKMYEKESKTDYCEGEDCPR